MKLSHYYNLVICKPTKAAQPTQLAQLAQPAPPPYPSPKGRGVKCVIPLVVRKVLCAKLLSIKEAFMSNPPISSGTFMRNSAPLSVRETLSVIPQANRFQHSPSLKERGLGGEAFYLLPAIFLNIWRWKRRSASNTRSNFVAGSTFSISL